MTVFRLVVRLAYELVGLAVVLAEILAQPRPAPWRQPPPFGASQ